jgi:hypothetical protein
LIDAAEMTDEPPSEARNVPNHSIKRLEMRVQTTRPAEGDGIYFWVSIPEYTTPMPTRMTPRLSVIQNGQIADRR